MQIYLDKYTTDDINRSIYIQEGKSTISIVFNVDIYIDKFTTDRYKQINIYPMLS